MLETPTLATMYAYVHMHVYVYMYVYVNNGTLLDSLTVWGFAQLFPSSIISRELSPIVYVGTCMYMYHSTHSNKTFFLATWYFIRCDGCS